ncbi:hypothetical protein ACEP3F_31345, partial [Pseudomonas aeruginosa]
RKAGRSIPLSRHDPIKVRNTESNRRLVNEMRSEGYLATVTSEDDVIIATTRPSAMTSEDA